MKANAEQEVKACWACRFQGYVNATLLLGGLDITGSHLIYICKTLPKLVLEYSCSHLDEVRLYPFTQICDAEEVS